MRPLFDRENELLIFGKGFNYSEDGPGNRLVYHLKGCNLHCPWCSNPDGLYAGENEAGTPLYTLLTEIISCRPMFFDGGGVTFTGGEVLCQPRAIEKLLVMLRENGIHTAVETNASLPVFQKLLPYIEYVIADFKHPQGKELKDATGASLSIIKDNLEAAAKSGKPLLVRVPFIHGFNDDEESLQGFAAYFNTLKALSGAVQFEILKYHEYGTDKWKKLGLPYTVSDGFVTAETLARFTAVLKEHGITPIHT